MSEQDKKLESVCSDKKDAKKAKDKKPGFFARVKRWFKDLKGELKKVTWPTVKDVVKNVGVVILCVLIVGVFIWAFDWLARAVISALMDLFG